ncbi:tyrosine-type recombinase/integrase [Pseudomonas rubra]|uniref:Tyrosine-type recombinase/integrase n=1 Tax=Pseudomonas rubra TaxID=2942627 RepID=A0ABT5P342_9PSED|nr:tyrosine-type recombinase/integrase [Pseudomonas rubra]MDD1012705.1 tyrosine-type recombinase/integrase [Pseudomonas rubra]MDD1041587.1 tyrosine-type recombinase/integrase [Pseudomonas rubra]MDD1155523.1 tyrosine-type recombinase/integrase [Pseudomonas rubra]
MLQVRQPGFGALPHRQRFGRLLARLLNLRPDLCYSLIGLLRRILERCGVPAALYTGHSLRRGFATWANSNGWELKALMGYVGWKDAKSALHYIDAAVSFGELAVLDTGPTLTLPSLP